MITSLGSFNIELYDDTEAPQNLQAPLTVANFLTYLNRRDYDNSFIHRRATIANSGVSVIQGGAVNCCISGQFLRIQPDDPVPNEFDPARSNVRGAISMAKTADPDSATSEWFINLEDNSAALDDTNNSGGFTVFGRVLDPGMDVVDAIGALDVFNFSAEFPDYPFSQLPVRNNSGIKPNPLFLNNFMYVNRLCLNNDADGVCTGTEDLAPNGDGNGDGVKDRDQGHVASIVGSLTNILTFAAEDAMKLDFIGIIQKDTVITWLQSFVSPPNLSLHFNNGAFNFVVTGPIGQNSRTVTLYHRAVAQPTHYYGYGPTPDNSNPHWYDFMYNGETGAEILDDRIVLHFVDGMRGDHDLISNSITHTGAQAVVTDTTTSSPQSGGCSIASTPSQTMRGGDWIIVSLFLVFLAVTRKRARHKQF